MWFKKIITTLYDFVGLEFRWHFYWAFLSCQGSYMVDFKGSWVRLMVQGSLLTRMPDVMLEMVEAWPQLPHHPCSFSRSLHHLLVGYSYFSHVELEILEIKLEATSPLKVWLEPAITLFPSSSIDWTLIDELKFKARRNIPHFSVKEEYVIFGQV